MLGQARRSLVAAWHWLEVGRLKGRLDRRAELFEVAGRLDEIGEHRWADETRKNGRAAPLRLLAPFEVNRAHPRRSMAMALGYVFFVLAMISGLLDRWQPWLAAAAPVFEVGMLGIGTWWVLTQSRIEHEVRDLLKHKEEHSV